MALKLRFNVCQAGDCSGVTFTETTGIYDAISNLLGWGTPNVALSSYEYAKIEFFLDGVLVHTSEFDDNGILPSNNDEFSYDIDVALADGVYTIVYTVQIDADTTTDSYSTTIYQSFFCNAKCCVMSMLNDIDVDCDCSEDTIERFNQAYALLKGLEYASGCGNISNFNNILAQINKICANSNCQNCQ